MRSRGNVILTLVTFASIMATEAIGFVIDTRAMVLNEQPPSLTGPVGLNLSGDYGEICDDAYFEQTEANVLCLSLGYNLASKNIENNASSKLWIANVDCSGSETNILDCNYNVINSTACYYAVNLTCSINKEGSGVVWWQIVLGVTAAIIVFGCMSNSKKKQQKQTAQNQGQGAQTSNQAANKKQGSGAKTATGTNTKTSEQKATQQANGPKDSDNGKKSAVVAPAATAPAQVTQVKEIAPNQPKMENNVASNTKNNGEKTDKITINSKSNDKPAEKKAGATITPIDSKTNQEAPKAPETQPQPHSVAPKASISSTSPFALPPLPLVEPATPHIINLSVENLPPPPTYSDLYPEHCVQFSNDYHPDDPFGPDSHAVSLKSTVGHLMEKGPELTFGEPQVIGGATFVAAAVKATSTIEVRKAFRKFMMGPGRMTARYNIAYFRVYNALTAKISEGCRNDGDIVVGKMIRSKLHAKDLYNIAVFLSENSDGSDVCSDTLKAMEEAVNSALRKWICYKPGPS